MRQNYSFSKNSNALLEPCEGKLSCTVLRGESPSNGADLLDTVYLFTESRKDEPEYGLFGLFDCMDRGKIKLEAVQHRPCGLRYEEYLPDEYRYVRKAKGDEIRDFCYLHGYDRCRIERLHTPDLRNPAAGVP